MAQQKYDLEKAAELQYGKLPQLQKQLEIEEEAVKKRDLSWCMKTSVRKRLRGSSPDGQEFRWQS